MAVTRRIGKLAIHFLGDNAEQLAGMFDDAHSRSKTFRRDMEETSRAHRNIYVGSALADLQDQPNFGNAKFNPESKEVKESPSFGSVADADTHFIVVKPGPHSLFHYDRRFDGSHQLALVHELLHPSQNTRELAQYGRLAEDNEHRTQRREQNVAVELGSVPGKDFPDVVGSGVSYGAKADPQPNSPPSGEIEPFAPIRYHYPSFVEPTAPVWREASERFEFPRYAAAGTPAPELPTNSVPAVLSDAGEDAIAADSRPVRYLSSRIAGKGVPTGFGAGATAPPLVPLGENFDPRESTTGDRFGG